MVYMKTPISSRRVWIARSIAVAVDALQIFAFPAFSEGFLAPFDPALDVVTAIIMIALLGWHIAFVPTFIVESLPFADLAPSWTIAVLIVTRGTPLKPGAVTVLPRTIE
jgi:hypothetical protein